MTTRAKDWYAVETKQPPPPPLQVVRTTHCMQQVADAVMELNRELVAQNIWLRDQLTADMNKRKSEYSGEDGELKQENERLRQQVLDLECKLERNKEVALLSAKIVESRIAYRDNQQFVEYKLQLETDSRGTLFVWHRYSTFRNLAESLQTKQGHSKKSVPDLPSKQVFGNFSEKVIHERVVKLNQFLDAATHGNHLQWGIRVDADTCVYKRRKKTATPPSSTLTTKQWALPSRKCDVCQYASIASAKVVDSRIQQQIERPFIEYELKLKTDTDNTVLVWYRYSSLHDWAEAIQLSNPCLKIPQLPEEEPFGSFPKHIQFQTDKLNAFLQKVVKSENLRWIARIDGDMFVCTLQAKDATLATPSFEQDLDPVASASKLSPLKTFKRVILYERKFAQAS
ncbi:Myosin [Phytophthora megakarya]|uniref:Myosin n=1 Tax=Phytophthora megakarya TaxID=4795 RepID=A0A225X1N4_9STRA|nr:Myosin [Phytophthora megakarya]